MARTRSTPLSPRSTSKRLVFEYVGTVDGLRQALIMRRRELLERIALARANVNRPPDPEPWLNDAYERGTTGPYEMDVDTMQRMLARAPVWNLRRRVR